MSYHHRRGVVSPTLIGNLPPLLCPILLATDMDNILPGSVALMEGLSRFVPELIRIDQDAVAPFSDQAGTTGLGGQDANSNGSSSNNNRKSADCLSWREYKCLTAAAGLSGQEPAETASQEQAAQGEEVDKEVAPSSKATAGITC